MQITPAICLLQRCCILHFKLFFVGIDFTVNFEYCEFLTFGTMESNEYINAKKIIEVKKATYAVESLK